jgi:hypothetical protein
MSNGERPRTAGWLVAALAVLLGSSAWAQGSGQGDAKEIGSYRLTDAGLAKFNQATRNLEPLEQRAASECRGDDGGDDGNGQTIDQVVARLNAKPGVPQAIKSAGMTTREYVVFTMAVFQAGMASWALSQPGGKLPPDVSMDNVNFYRKHEASMQKVGQAKPSQRCDQDDGASDDQGDG